jgi:hypothetical protein
MENQNHVLIVGDLSEGFSFYGPFDHVDLAIDFALEKFGSRGWTVEQLETPEESE